ncbi:hypothetical protein ACFV1W_30240 [Kitasatospora sp. NPDC059648]|uniref:hypothetical protein n=1 Tax=Kitasatospora sp. NPDC059648 TaxID=3346894 RepID=UPI00369666F3
MSPWGTAIVAVVAVAALWQLRVYRRRPQDQPTVAESVLASAPLTPAAAYADAPGIGDELAALWVAQAAEAEPGAEYGAAEHREQLLRWAAVWDRLALEDALAGTGAAAAAYLLQAHDHIYDSQAGPYGPHSIEWDQPRGGRLYVRQEYAAWRAGAERTAQ